jgi:hypothetical protein
MTLRLPRQHGHRGVTLALLLRRRHDPNRLGLMQRAARRIGCADHGRIVGVSSYESFGITKGKMLRSRHAKTAL